MLNSTLANYLSASSDSCLDRDWMSMNRVESRAVEEAMGIGWLAKIMFELVWGVKVKSSSWELFYSIED